jgi:hypothetical protein
VAEQRNVLFALAGEEQKILIKTEDKATCRLPQKAPKGT